MSGMEKGPSVNPDELLSQPRIDEIFDKAHQARLTSDSPERTAGDEASSSEEKEPDEDLKRTAEDWVRQGFDEQRSYELGIIDDANRADRAAIEAESKDDDQNPEK
jgi:hypothetical protein